MPERSILQSKLKKGSKQDVSPTMKGLKSIVRRSTRVAAGCILIELKRYLETSCRRAFGAQRQAAKHIEC